MNELLSICIPTHNRAGHLGKCLDRLLPQAMKADIPIYISDNASTDNTQDIVAAYARKYPNIIYSRSQKNQGAEINFVKVLRMSKTKYAWFFGDDDRLVENAVAAIINVLLMAEYDMVVVNGGKKLKGSRDLVKGRVDDLSAPATYKDRNKLLTDLGWHMTWISCLIYSRKLIANANFEKFIRSRFMQFAVVFDYLAEKKVAVRWEPRPFVYSAATDLPGWAVDAFGIFGREWFDEVMALPKSYLDQAKKACIMSHGVKAKIFGLRYLLILRFLGLYDFSVYKKYNSYFKYLSNLPKFIMWLIAAIPCPRFFSDQLRKIAVSRRQEGF